MKPKVKLVSLIKKGDREKEISQASAEQQELLKKNMEAEEKLLSIKRQSYEAASATKSMYIALQMSTDKKIEEALSKIRSHLTQAKWRVNDLQWTKKKGEVIKHAISLGYHRAQAEVLKSNLAAMRGEAEAYEGYAETAKHTVALLKAEVDKIEISVNMKRELLENSQEETEPAE